MTETATDIRAGIERVRRVKGWSQAQLGDFLGIDQSTVSRIETGASEPSGPVRRLLDMLIGETVQGASEAAE